ncbi:hypothetical protein LguiB_013266 [Lonicera macranthoides]
MMREWLKANYSVPARHLLFLYIYRKSFTSFNNQASTETQGKKIESKRDRGLKCLYKAPGPRHLGFERYITPLVVVL